MSDLDDHIARLLGASEVTTNSVRRLAERVAMEDCEEGHKHEDELRAGVLKAIAEGRALNPASVAREALKTNPTVAARWYS